MPGVIKINPETFKDERDALAVAWNEALRLFMEDTRFEPEFDITPEQENFFAGTAYADGDGSSAEKGGNVLDPDSWGGSGGKVTMRAATRGELLAEERSKLPVLEYHGQGLRDIVGAGPATGNKALDAVTATIGVATTFGPAVASASGGGMGGLVKAAGASTGAPGIKAQPRRAITQAELGRAIRSEEDKLSGQREKSTDLWGTMSVEHALGGKATQSTLRKLGISYDISEAHRRGEALYSDIGAYADEGVAGFEGVSKAISVARKQNKLLSRGGFDPNTNTGDQLILSGYTATPSPNDSSRPGRGNSRLRYVINPVSKENIIAAYNTDAFTGRVSKGGINSYADAFLKSKMTGVPIDTILSDTRTEAQVKAPLLGRAGNAIQPSIAGAVEGKPKGAASGSGHNEIVVRPQIGDFYIEDTIPSAGALPAKLQNQMKRLRQAYSAAHGGSIDPLATPTRELPRSFNPGMSE